MRKTLGNGSLQLNKDACIMAENRFFWLSHCYQSLNGNLLKYDLTVAQQTDGVVRNAALSGRMPVKLFFLLPSVIDRHDGGLKLCTDSFNPSITVIQSFRTHLSLILAAVPKPINQSKSPSLLLA